MVFETEVVVVAAAVEVVTEVVVVAAVPIVVCKMELKFLEQEEEEEERNVNKEWVAASLCVHQKHEQEHMKMMKLKLWKSALQALVPNE